MATLGAAAAAIPEVEGFRLASAPGHFWSFLDDIDATASPATTATAAATAAHTADAANGPAGNGRISLHDAASDRFALMRQASPSSGISITEPAK